MPRLLSLSKKPRRVCAECANQMKFIFSGDMKFPPRGIAAAAYAENMPLACFLIAAASEKILYSPQVWDLSAASGQILRTAGRVSVEKVAQPLF